MLADLFSMSQCDNLIFMLLKVFFSCRQNCLIAWSIYSFIDGAGVSLLNTNSLVMTVPIYFVALTL